MSIYNQADQASTKIINTLLKFLANVFTINLRCLYKYLIFMTDYYNYRQKTDINSLKNMRFFLKLGQTFLSFMS